MSGAHCPPMSTKTAQHAPHTISQRLTPTRSLVGQRAGMSVTPGPGSLGGTSCLPFLTSASSKYTQRVMLCRIMLLVYSSCLHSKDLRSLRSSPEVRPWCSRSMARPRQPPSPVQDVDSEVMKEWEQRERDLGTKLSCLFRRAFFLYAGLPRVVEQGVHCTRASYLMLYCLYHCIIYLCSY